MDLDSLRGVMCLTPAYNSDKEDGRCHICRKTAKLTREHIPPRSAFNGSDALWDRLVTPEKAAPSAKQIRIKGGLFVRTLCKACNNGRCSKYASEYVRFVRHLVESPQLFDATGTARLVSVPSDTLFLAKQIATMILAIEPSGYADHNTGLREFVINEYKIFEPNFRVFAFLVPDVPEAGTVTRYHARVSTFAPGFEFMGGEVSSFPFGIVYASQIGKGYDLRGLTDVTRWFTTDNIRQRQTDAVTLHRRVTGVESIQCAVGNKRVRPQIDYIG